MLGLSSSLIKKAGMPLQWIKDGLKLYMPYRGDVTNKGTQFVGTGSTSFDGTNDYIAVADSNDFSFGDGSTDSAFSISAWVNMDDTSDFRIINKGIYNSTAEWGFEVAGNTLILYLYDESVSSTYESASFALTTTGTWIHVACTYTGVGGTSANAGIKLYKNGVSQSLTLDDGGTYVAMENLAADVWIGRYSASYAEGSMKNVAIWNRALTATEVQNVMYKTYAEVSGRLASGLVSWWALDVDYTDYKGSNNGTNYGSTLNTDLYGGDTPVIPRGIDNAPTVQADAIGAGSALFNGSSEYISCGNDSSLQVGTSDFSVTAWVYRTADDGAIFGYGDTSPNPFFHIYENDTEKIRVRINDGGGDTNMKSSASSFAEDEWTHVAVTIDRDSATGGKIYFDGIEATVDEDDFTSQQSTLVNGSVGAYIGARASGGIFSSFHAGNICQVGLWSRVLTQAEIQSVMEKTYEEFTASEKTNLVSYWALDEALAGDAVVEDKVDETLGSELVTNGGFDSATTSWTPTRSTIASIAGGQSGNCLEITWASGSTQYAAQGLGTVATVGKVYKITWQVKSGTSGDEAYIIRVWDGSDYVVSDERTSSSSWVEGTAFWLAATTTITVELWKNSSTEATMLFDTISVKETNGNPGVLI